MYIFKEKYQVHFDVQFSIKAYIFNRNGIILLWKTHHKIMIIMK